MTLRTGRDLRELRERKPLVHQITNYVVMNETANATLALGALPVMAHAQEEVEELASVAGALVLNIGTLSGPWIEAMLLAAKAANEADVPVVLDPVGAGATTLRTETAKRILDEAEIAVVRGNAAEGDRVIDVSNGHALLVTVTGTGCMATAVTGCFLAVRPDAPLEAAAEALVAFGVAGEDAAEGAKGPGTFHAQLYDALYNLDPETIDGRARANEAARVSQ
jgi:hydroxyethylthiazole kinase